MIGRRTRVHQRLVRATARCIADFSLIEEGDRLMCAVSGGKDSFGLHALLVELRGRAPISFDLVAVNIDQGAPGFASAAVAHFFVERGHAVHTVREDTCTIVQEKVEAGRTPCPLCSRLRRAILYRVAREIGCNKVVLGHHRDDVLATLLLNLMFSGQLKAMPPRLRNDAGDLELIRPLAYCAEDDLATFAAEQGFPVQPCGLCGSQGPGERKAATALLRELEQRHPGVQRNMLAALRNVRPSHLFDAGLWRRLGLRVATETDGGDSP